ncbi:MAG TPA: orotate phosphoribosyltransferase [Methanothrix sp.]|nr:orotate phosphoribosyltransferase [Methanothrix sp.]HRW82015.1 orotate phosphoribosyltransferase [Methanothrix sp.]
MEDRERLLELLRKRALRVGRIVLSSGKVSDYYVDAREVVLHPEGAYLTGRLLLDMIDPEAVAVAGMTLGADPIVTSISVVGHLQGRELSALIIRKEPKKHGTGKFVEGPALPEGSKVAVVDDVVTTGSSLIKSIDRLRAAGYEPVQVVAILDREEGGSERLKAAGYSLSSIFTRADLLAKK